MNAAWWLFRVECSGKTIYQSPQKRLSDAQAQAELASTMQAHAGKAGCTACALRLHDKKWMTFDCRPVPAAAKQMAPRHFASHAAPHSTAFAMPRRHSASDTTPHSLFAMPATRPRTSWGMRGLGAEAATAAEVIEQNPPGEPHWIIKHWPWLLVGSGVLAAGLIWVGTRDD